MVLPRLRWIPVPAPLLAIVVLTVVVVAAGWDEVPTVSDMGGVAVVVACVDASGCAGVGGDASDYCAVFVGVGIGGVDGVVDDGQACRRSHGLVFR